MRRRGPRCRELAPACQAGWGTAGRRLGLFAMAVDWSMIARRPRSGDSQLPSIPASRGPSPAARAAVARRRKRVARLVARARSATPTRRAGQEPSVREAHPLDDAPCAAEAGAQCPTPPRRQTARIRGCDAEAAFSPRPDDKHRASADATPNATSRSRNPRTADARAQRPSTVPVTPGSPVSQISSKRSTSGFARSGLPIDSAPPERST